MIRPVLKRGNSAGRLRPLSLSKPPRLSDGLPTSRIDDSLSSPTNLSSHYRNDSRGMTTPYKVSCVSPSCTVSNGSSNNLKNHRNQNDPKSNWMNLPPQTNWNISDTSLKPIPSYYPPLISSNCTFISDARPSVVTARIAQCLMRRSLIAKYDDIETRATVFGGDMTSFEIRLYRGKKKVPALRIPLMVDDGGVMSASSKNMAQTVVQSDFPHGIIVECTRIRGDVISFHRDCQAVLAGARGNIDCVDERRRPFGVLLTPRYGISDVGIGALWDRQKEAMAGGGHCGNWKKGEEEKNSCNTNDHRGINELLSPPPQSTSYSSPLSTSISSSPSNENMKTSGQLSDVARSVYTALETSLSLLEKDNICAQLLGMQSLVFLTDLKSSHLDKAYLSSLCVLGSPINYIGSLHMNFSSSADCDEGGSMGGGEEREEDALSISTITSVHDRIIRIIMEPGDDMHNDDSTGLSSCRDQDTATLSNSSSFSSTMSNQVSLEHHISMRRMAIQAFTNALSTIVSNSNSFPLLPPLHCPTLHREEFIKSVKLDLAETPRLPISMLTSAHDVAPATRLLCLIVRYYSGYTSEYGIGRDKNCTDWKIGDMGFPTKKVWDLLETAWVDGISCHGDLEVETVFNDLAIGRNCGCDVDME